MESYRVWAKYRNLSKKKVADYYKINYLLHHKLHSACISTTSRLILQTKLCLKVSNEGYLHIYGI